MDSYPQAEKTPRGRRVAPFWVRSLRPRGIRLAIRALGHSPQNVTSVGFLDWIVVGLIAGAIAKTVTGDRFGRIVTIILGIVGAFAGVD